MLKTLSEEGFQATPGRIRSAIKNGYIYPSPERGPRGAYNFTERHLFQLRWYFCHIRPGPLPRKLECFPLRSVHDRIHRKKRRDDRLRRFNETLEHLQRIADELRSGT